MNQSTAFGRKLVYLSVLVAMLVPLYLLGQPAGGGSDAGGLLARMRDDFNISESDLGEISPASQTMKLASLGLRGVAATLLWKKAHHYRVTHEWDRLKATVNNITLLQPNSDKVWEFHAHNLSYNVSTEFDDYRQRYSMVREGTEFLQRGVRQNQGATRLIWYTGWFYGSKMGTADEKVQFRRLFADDTVLHERLLTQDIDVESPDAKGPLGKPDNWLVGRLWLNRGYDLVESGVEIRRQTPLNFYETGPKWRMRHAEAIEKEGVLDERAQTAWQLASEDWKAFGQRDIPAVTAPYTIRLAGLDDLVEKRSTQLDKFKEITGETFVAARKANVEKLPENLQEILAKPITELTSDEQLMVPMIEQRVLPNLAEVAKNCDPKVRLQALDIARELVDIEDRARKTDGYRNQINYLYWQTLAQAEKEDRTILARRLVYEAEQHNEKAEIDEAIKKYDEAFEIWAKIFDDYPMLTLDDSADDLYESIRKYMIAIDSQDLPENFPLAAFTETMRYAGSTDSPSYEQIKESMEMAKQRAEELERENELLDQKMKEEGDSDASDSEEKAESDEASAEEKPESDVEPEGDAEQKPDATDGDTTESPESSDAESDDNSGDSGDADSGDADASEESADGDDAAPTGDES